MKTDLFVLYVTVTEVTVKIYYSPAAAPRVPTLRCCCCYGYCFGLI